MSEKPIETLKLTHGQLALYQTSHQMEGIITAAIHLQQPERNETSQFLKQLRYEMPTTQCQQPYSSTLSSLTNVSTLLAWSPSKDITPAFAFELEFELLNAKKGLAYRYPLVSSRQWNTEFSYFQESGKTFGNLQHQIIKFSHDKGDRMLYLAQPGALSDYLSRKDLLMVLESFPSDDGTSYLMLDWFELEQKYRVWEMLLIDLVILLDTDFHSEDFHSNPLSPSAKLLVDSILAGLPLPLINQSLSS